MPGMSRRSRHSTTVLAHDRFVRLGAEHLVADDAPTGDSQYPTDAESIVDSLLDPDTAPRPASRHPWPAGDTRHELARATTARLTAILDARHPIGTANLPQMTAEDAQEAARAVLAVLPVHEFNYRWARIEAARAREALFSQPDGPACASVVLPTEEAITVEDALGRTPDSDPENPDWQLYADILATAWQDLRMAAVDEAVLALVGAWPEPT